MTPRDLPPCGRCGLPASHGFGRPGGLRSDWPDLGTLHDPEGTVVSVELLRDILSYDGEAGTFIWKERNEALFDPGKYGRRDDVAASWNSKFAGKPALKTRSAKGYLVGQIFRRQVKAHRVAWAMYYGRWPHGQIDHINGDIQDNRISNLRCVDSVGNGRNKSIPVNCSSGTVGVYYTSHRWRAHIYDHGRHISLGMFNCKTAAIVARKVAEREIGFHPNHGRKKHRIGRHP